MTLSRFITLLCASIVAITMAGAAFAREAPVDEGGAEESWTPFEELVQKSKSAMMGDPPAALEHAAAAAKDAEQHAESPRRMTALATSYWLQSEALTRMNKTAEAKPILAKGIDLAAHDGLETKLDGDLLLSQGRLAGSTGDFGTTLISFQSAYDVFLRLGEARSQAIALQALGSVYAEARAFDRVVDYYERASKAFSGDPSLELSSANNRGNSLRELGRSDEALTQFKHALTIAGQMNSPLLEARILTNIAALETIQGDYDEADAASDRAFTLLASHPDNGWDQFVWGIKARIALRRGQTQTAIADINKAFAGVDITTTTTPYRDMHEIAAEVFSAAGQNELALAHHRAFKRLDDHGRDLSASANLALLGAQFDFANQQLEISQLKSGQLESALALEQARTQQRHLILVAMVLICLVAIAWIATIYRSAKRHARQINIANDKLKELVADLNIEIERRISVEADLMIAKTRAETANRAKSQFLANMSHELRTPLNAIIGFAEMMRMQVLGPVGNPAYLEYVTDIHKSGGHLLDVLNDILEMARIDSGSITLEESTVDLHDFAQECLSVYRATAEAAHLQLTLRNTAREVYARVDEKLLRQALANLITNAIKFTPAGGQIAVTLADASEGGIDILVADTGIGIPPDKLEMILEPFNQVADAFARSHGGLGLGLPIVKALAALHGGTLSLESEVDRGTTARIHLPPERVIVGHRTQTVAKAG